MAVALVITSTTYTPMIILGIRAKGPLRSKFVLLSALLIDNVTSMWICLDGEAPWSWWVPGLFVSVLALVLGRWFLWAEKLGELINEIGESLGSDILRFFRKFRP